MSDSCKEFAISAAVKNIKRFVNREDYFTNIEKRFHIPWRMVIEKNDEHFSFFLCCDKEEWSVETEYTLKLTSQNGKSLSKKKNKTFEESHGYGYVEFISWKELEKDFVVDDCIIIEAHVKIIKISEKLYSALEKLYIAATSQRTFIMHHTVKNVSSFKQGTEYTTGQQREFNIPWRLQFKRVDGFLAFYLICELEIHSVKWTIEGECNLKLVAPNGQSLPSRCTFFFNTPTGCGVSKFVRWDDMLERYAANDSLIVEAHVAISEMTIGTPPQKVAIGLAMPARGKKYHEVECLVPA